MNTTTRRQTQRHVRALPAWFGGVLYRSRTEARWAAFFTRLQQHGLDAGFTWEEQGFAVDGRGYLPDFFLPGQALIAEVKPDFGTDPDGVARWIALIEARGKERGVLLTSMHSGPMEFLLIGPQADGGHWEEDGATWLVCPGGYHLDIGRVPPIGCPRCPQAGGYWYEDQRIAGAFAYARSYRFGRPVSSG